MGNNDRRPKIRFKGFNDDWEQHKLGNLGYTYTGLSGKTKNDFGHGDGKFITYINVFSNTIADCNLVESVEIDKKQNKVEYGDILFTTSSETPKEVGMSSVYLGNEDNIYLNSFCFGFKPTYKFDNYYIAYILRSVYVRKKIIPLAQGISRYNISKSKMMEIQINLPCMIEQKKIGEFFKQLDNDITLHQRKLEKLGNIKKSMLEKMFPKDENKVPEIRFKGFNDDWEQHKLNEISQRVQNNDGRMNLPTLTISAANGWMNQQDRFYGNIAGKEQKNYTLLSKGELSYNHGNSKLAKYGAVFVLRTYEEALVPRVYHSFKIINGIPDFIEYYFATKIPDIELAKIISSGARMDGLLNISYDEFSNIKFKLPSEKEQFIISSFLRKLDSLIALHQRKPIFGNGGN